ncbi:MAG: hypothetical protein ABUJ92_00145 [Desulfobacterales bacterium]
MIEMIENIQMTSLLFLVICALLIMATEKERVPVPDRVMAIVLTLLFVSSVTALGATLIVIWR